ncbi:MAG: OmpA family protein [Paracoccaceae bacterium]
MRLLLVILCVALMGVTGWHAVQTGTDETYLAGAPQVELKVNQGVRDALRNVAGPDISVETDGRNVTLTGPVNGEARRDEILALAGAVPLLGRLVDRMEVLQSVSPFTFSAERASNGQITLEGHVPNRTIEDAVLAQARAIAGGAEVQSQLTIAAGAPEADWAAITGTGIAALSGMEEGRFELSDLDAGLTGRVSDKPSGDVVNELVARATEGNWTIDLEGAVAGAEDFQFTAMKTVDGGIIVDGVAPDADTAKALRDAATGAGSTVEGELALLEGVPDANWVNNVRQGLDALARTQAGLLAVSGTTIDLTADVDTNEDLAALMPSIGTDWKTSITVLNPPPDADVTIELDADGGITARGVLPDGLGANTLAAMLPGLDVAGLDLSQTGAPMDWTGPAEALNIVLPRMETATSRITGERLTISGVLRRGFSADNSTAAVQIVMPDTWELDLDLNESAPLSGIVFSKRDQEIVLSGVLPQDLSEDVALALAGTEASGEALASAGTGDAEAWRGALTGLTSALEPFVIATGEINEGSVAIDGTLRPGYTANEVQIWMSRRLPADWELGLTANTTAASEGDDRRNLITGESETFRNGYWLPDVDFAVTPQGCEAEIDKALSKEQIAFLTGSAQIDDDGRALLNRLAAVAVRCLNSSVMTLDIAGHTDSVGNDENNQALSEKRAEAVRAALAARGVRGDAMTARGFGETQPIESNNTADGRARNRRIDFVWSAEGN